MANFAISQSVQYFGGLKDAESDLIDPPAIISNNEDGNEFSLLDLLTTTNLGNTVAIGNFEGVTTIDSAIFVVVYVGVVEGSDAYFLLGPNPQSFAAFPDSFAALTINQNPFTVCFLAGTRIATPAGEVAVEALAIGDRVLTADGRAAPVRWVGVQTVVSVFADPLRSFPICISAGALGEGLPVRDLLVSPDHALMLDGALVQAGALVNGTTIVRETEMPERFTYFHVELEDHSLILAEGVPAETFLDTVTRRRFDNWAEHEALYGPIPAPTSEMAMPRIKSARQLPRWLRGGGGTPPRTPGPIRDERSTARVGSSS
jgi:hypothetical protein